MRLKQHRYDIKELRSAGHIGIAIRYHRLILAMEETTKAQRGFYTDRTRRVIRDAEVGK